MLYVATKDPDKAVCMLSSIDTRPVLTIGESRNFIHAGGLINFYRKGKKIRFEINAQAARESGFKISSQLLKLARIVESEAP